MTKEQVMEAAQHAANRYNVPMFVFYAHGLWTYGSAGQGIQVDPK